MKPNRLITAALVTTCLFTWHGITCDTAWAAESSTVADAKTWLDHFYPYRIEITLDKEYKGEVSLDVTTKQLIEALTQVSVDTVTLDSFAFEKAVLADPASHKIIGGFKLVPESPNLAMHGDFDSTTGMSNSPWVGFDREKMKIKPLNHGGRPLNALWATGDVPTNTWLSQPLNVDVGDFYLLSYLVYHDSVNGSLSVGIYDPDEWFFANYPSSYIKSLQPSRQWTRCFLLDLADVPKPELRILTGYAGTCAVTDIEAKKISWRLLAEFPRKLDKVHLYYVPRAGHRFTVPTTELIEEDFKSTVIAQTSTLVARSQDVNPEGVLVKGKFMEAWTLPSEYPLKMNMIPATRPMGSVAKPKAHLNLFQGGSATGRSRHVRGSAWAHVNLFQGGSATLLIAVRTGTPLVKILSAGCDLPLDVKFEHLAPIPVYSGSYYEMQHEGDLVETRLDALMPLNDPGIAPNQTGIHVLAVTFTSNENADPGTFNSAINLTIQSQVPETESIEIPIEARVLPVMIRPVDHFGTSFGGNHIARKYDTTYDGILWKDSTPPAAFHGFSEPYSGPDITKLFRTYYHRMMDYCVMPAMLPHPHPYSYKIIDQGPGLAPKLSDWTFTGLDQDLDEFILNRNGRWFSIYGTNGCNMHMLRLIDGITYSFKDPPDDTVPWKKLEENEYFKLVGDYFDAIAKRLHEKNCLDKVTYHIDESDPTTYLLIHKYAKTLDARPYASQLKMEHTTYKPATWTMRLPNENLILDEALDIFTPQNNDLFNYFEPEYNSRMRIPGKIQWVYYTETDHFDLLNAGLSTVITPLKLRNFGGQGWLCWGSFMWSFPVKKSTQMGPEFPDGQVVNPWLNPFYSHGPGVLSFFYPPDPRGIADDPTYKIIPSYRLALMRDGIQLHGLFEVLSKGVDDKGRVLKINKEMLVKAEQELARLWTDNTVQWYVSYESYRLAKRLLYDALEE